MLSIGVQLLSRDGGGREGGREGGRGGEGREGGGREGAEGERGREEEKVNRDSLPMD